jgi:glycosyltransferase involved in cell wall biosynthesis
VTGVMRVLVLIQGPLGDRPTGPEIRGWEMARAFANRHDVTAAASVQHAHRRDGIAVVPRTRRRILAELMRHDVVIGPVIPPYALLALSGRRCLRVADLYDPVELELGTLEGWRARRAMAQQRGGRDLHLRWSDVIVCANGRQLERTRRDLDDVPRRDGGPALFTVPMGLPDLPEPSADHLLRAHFPAIGADDPVVLWWGSVWRWLDAGTAIEAIGRLAASRPDVRLVITAGKPSNAATDRLNATEEARDLARRTGLLDRNVFFLDEWVPFEQRHRYLCDADVGITLHGATEEASLAARARYMDYVWAALPSVLAEGDEVGDRLAAAGAARLVAPHDPQATAAALDALLGAPAALREAQQACRDVAAEYAWDTLLAPLVEGIEALDPATRSAGGALGVARAAGGYYARRLVDRCAIAVAG